jgi:hypothetical protein
MAYSLQGISGPFATKMSEGMAKLGQVAIAARQGVLNPAGPYSTWFGAADHAAYGRVRQIVEDIHTALTTGHVTFVNAVGEDSDMDLTGVYGYTYKRNIQIYNQVGRNGTTWVWMVPKANQRELVLTLYHELSHALGNTDDLTYSTQLCRFYASKNPGLAANNAENYCQFAGEFY